MLYINVDIGALSPAHLADPLRVVSEEPVHRLERHLTVQTGQQLVSQHLATQVYGLVLQ